LIYWPSFIAHRGASAIAPENTIESLKLAIELGAQSVEFDVQPTQDQELVVFHDETLKRSSSIKAAIYDCALETLQKTEVVYQFGLQNPAMCIPSFDAYLKVIEEAGMYFNAELKCFHPQSDHCAEYTDPFLDRFIQAGEKCLVTSSCKQCLKIMRAKHDDLQLGLIVGKMKPDALEFVHELGLVSISMDYNYVTSHEIELAQKHHLALMAYTVNHYETAKKLLEQGVNSVFSDVVF
jgi:glycerophosphoryl diester phosphodiesterase